MWTILGIVAVVLLLVYFRGMNAVWGGLTIAVFGGVVGGVVWAFVTGSFPWLTIAKLAIVGILLGGALELFGKLASPGR